MPDVLSAGVRADSMIMRATYFTADKPEESTYGFSARIKFGSRVGGDAYRPSLWQVGRACEGLDRLLHGARYLADPETPERAVLFPSLHEGPPRTPRLVSVEMRSPLTVILEFPEALGAPFMLAALWLAQRFATLDTRVSKERARDLRDRAAFDRQRQLIDQGRVDGLLFGLRDFPRPDTIEIFGGDEDPDTAEPGEPPALPEPQFTSGDLPFRVREHKHEPPEGEIGHDGQEDDGEQ